MVNFEYFIRHSGLKVLAMARLNPCEYSLVLYLLNTSASGLDEVITTEREMASLIGYSERDIREAASKLAERQIINIRVGDGTQPAHRQSLRIGVQYDTKEWALDFDEDVTSHDAIVFPFRRGQNLQIVETTEPPSDPSTWERVYHSYTEDRSLSELEKNKARLDAKILVDTHPVDQVLLMLRHFRDRIPTLSLLASSWQHYQEMFEDETQKVDLFGARQKHHELDDRFREAVLQTLERKDELDLSSEEVGVLEILVSHRHPRRQLFWAYQLKGRYPNLKEFFEENSKHMLPVTSSGIVVKKRPHQD